jgi:hypothetical protein
LKSYLNHYAQRGIQRSLKKFFYKLSFLLEFLRPDSFSPHRHSCPTLGRVFETIVGVQEPPGRDFSSIPLERPSASLDVGFPGWL